LSRGLAAVRYFLVFDGLALIEAAEAGFLDSRDMDKHIFSTTTLRLNKSVAFCELNHFTVPVATITLHCSRYGPTIIRQSAAIRIRL
jgi:hypothetical protein